jgi:hypothetical protein
MSVILIRINRFPHKNVEFPGGLLVYAVEYYEVVRGYLINPDCLKKIFPERGDRVNMIDMFFIPWYCVEIYSKGNEKKIGG